MKEIKEEIERLNLLDRHKDYVNTSSDLQEYGWSADLDLRPYQVIGLNWLLSRYYRHHGCILGDEMGLGKTCQTIASMLYLRQVESLERPDIVICPRSVLENWRDEFKRFAPGMLVRVYTGDKNIRKAIQNSLLPKDDSSAYPFDVLITTYEICIRDNMFFSEIPWHLMVIDEAHRLKNQNSLLRETLSQWSTTQRILLTGTPVQNNLKELYSLLNFVAESIFLFNLKDKFVWKFSDTENEEATSDLHHILQPFLLRRIKQQVLKDLPEKSEVILFHGLSTVQKKLYKAILTKDLSAFATNSYNPDVAFPRSLINILMELRKCVNHPYLFDGVEPEPFNVGEHLVESSQKLVLIDRLLNHLKATGHKVLIFSQMTRMLDILQDYLTYRDYTYERLDGSVRGDERYLAVKNFNLNDDTFVFLLSTRAGGQGLNLASADTVIFVDSDFNPQNDLQAASRAHRIGQSRPVKILRLIGSNTVEEIILRRAEMKLKLTEKVVEEGQFSILPQKGSNLSLITDSKVKLQDIIKFGVDKLLQDSSGDTGANDVDLISLLGKSEDGQWMQSAANGTCNGEDNDIELSEEKNSQAGPSHMYEFEGTDYSHEPSKADEDTFNKLLLEEKAKAEEKLNMERSRRQAGSAALFEALPDPQPKVRKPMSPDELEERRKKRQLTMEQKAKLRAEKQAQRKAELWKENDYISCSVTLEPDDSEGTKEDEDDDEDFAIDIQYISGDVTRPINSPDNENCIIVHCADDSGCWGTGGVFHAISSRSDIPKEQYELAQEMEDLFLGDCHMIPMEDMHIGLGKSYWLGLIIAQHRDKKNNLSGIKLDSLSTGLDKVYQFAKKKDASVHLPRIGHDTPDFNWYGTERMLRKKLAARGIPTFVYYYPRHRAMKRKMLTDSNSSPLPSTSKDYQYPSWQYIDSSSEEFDSEDISENFSEELSESEDFSEPISEDFSEHGSENSSEHELDDFSEDLSSPSVLTKGRYLNKNKKKSNALLDIFQGTSIYCWNLSEEETKMFKRYIIAYDADFDTEIHDSTTHIIVKPEAGLQFEDLQLLIESVCCTAVIVTIDWLKKCIKTGYCYPTEPFEVDFTAFET